MAPLLWRVCQGHTFDSPILVERHKLGSLSWLDESKTLRTRRSRMSLKRASFASESNVTGL